MRLDTWVCIAGGKSLVPRDVNWCRGKSHVAVVNDGYLLAPWADLHYAADHRWWIAKRDSDRTHEERSRHMRERATSDPGTSEMFGLTYVPHEMGKGRGQHPRVRGTHSGGELINLVANRGARRILLLGYDMGATGLGHWFGDHPHTVTIPTPHGSLVQTMNTADEKQFAEWCEEMRYLAEDLKRAGVEVVNCTRVTAITCFPRQPIEEALP